VKILTISDTIERKLYHEQCKECCADIDLILSCGDLPFYYLEFLVTMVDVPLYYVFGNHHIGPMLTANGNEVHGPGGCVNIDNKIVEFQGLLIGGFEGCMLYNYGPKQYSEYQMRQKIFKMKFQLWKNKLFKKRYVDLVITHAPPAGIHDQPDRCHQGFKSFRTFIETYKPRYFVHGHTHRYSAKDPWQTQYQETMVINTSGYRILDIENP
jgi:Icc-related predicted phosphoesterase